MNAVRRPTVGVRCHALLVTSLGSQAHIPTTAFAVAGSKKNDCKQNVFTGLD